MARQQPVRDRIKEFRRLRPSDLLENPSNWRYHPDFQRKAIRSVFGEIGMADALLAYETPQGLTLIDGHLRLEELQDCDSVPCLVLDLTDEEAAKLLATFDPIGDMAETDNKKLHELLKDMEANDADFFELVSTMEREVEPPEVSLRPVVTSKPPDMTWVLVGIPTVRFGEIAEAIERIASLPDIHCETSVTNAKKEEAPNENG